jgi:pyruvate dehydrogenase E1 component alpha subunit
VIPDIPVEQVPEIFDSALLIRRFEEAVVRVGPESLGWYHTAMGQECTAVVVAQQLRPTDFSSTSHRNHAQALARGAAPEAVMAEIFGKAAGVNGGFGGSMHLVSPEHGIITNSAMLGGGAPQMVGAALTQKLRGSDGISVTWFGDGTVAEGAVHEALCLASLWQVPMVFMCENDRTLEVTPTQATGSVPAREVADIPAGFNVSVRSVDGSDVGLLYDVVRNAVAAARTGKGPSFIEVRTQAWPGRSTDPTDFPGGPMDMDLVCGLRPISENEEPWQVARDPLMLFTRELIVSGAMSIEDVKAADARVLETVQAAVEFARSAPFPEATAAGRGYGRTAAALGGGR